MNGWPVFGKRVFNYYAASFENEAKIEFNNILNCCLSQTLPLQYIAPTLAHAPTLLISQENVLTNPSTPPLQTPQLSNLAAHELQK